MAGHLQKNPKHFSIFDFTTDEVEMPPALENLRTHPPEVESRQALLPAMFATVESRRRSDREAGHA